MAQSNVIHLLSPNNDDDDAQTAYTTDYLNLKELSTRLPPLGLKLTVTPEMLQLTEHKTKGTPFMPDVKKVEKLKASHFPICMLTIGFFKIEAKYPADLVAKFYYAKRKLVWEMLRDGLKDKIEIQWQNISAIRASVGENSLGILEIELDRAPLFFREIEPKPGKHTIWTISHDFTSGQASRYRKHYLQFPPGVLNQHYAKLLQCDNRLLELNQRPFPSLQCAYFDSHLDQGTTYIAFGRDLHVHGPKFTTTNEAINNQMLQDPILTSWSQGLEYDTSLSIESVSCASSGQQNRLGSNHELPSHINNMLLRGYHIPENEFNRRHIRDNVDQSMEASLYNTNANTQIDWLHTNKKSWNIHTDDSEQLYYSCNVNLNAMYGTIS